MHPESRHLKSLCVLWVTILSGVACASEPVQQVGPKVPKTGVAAGADLSKCEYKDRTDRTFAITRGPGAQHANVLRVFDVSVDSAQARRVLRCRQVDTNLDGIRDVIRIYDDEGEPTLEQSDSDYDGRIDTWVRFSRGRVLRTEFDRNHDGKPDEFRVYTSGKLSRIQRDTDFNGRLDTWEVYDGERLHRVGVDADGDERVDRWYRASSRERERLQGSETSAESTSDERDRARHRAPVEVDAVPADEVPRPEPEGTAEKPGDGEKSSGPSKRRTP